MIPCIIKANAKLSASIEEESQAATENEATVRRLQAKMDTISALLEVGMTAQS